MKKILLLFSALALMACGGSAPQTSKTQSTDKAVDVTEVIYFHGKQRCVTCNEIERLAREVVDSLSDGHIIMTIVDISTPEGEQIAEAYQVSWSALYVERNGTTENLTDMGFIYAKGAREIFKAKLLESIKNIAK